MGHLPLPAVSTTHVFRDEPAGIDIPVASSSENSNLATLLEVLREAIAGRVQSTDAILGAVADSARVLTSADGVALASRLNGQTLCRARSGEIAPAVGAPVNSESGISGACLRTGKVLVCEDALSDSRVDADVCQQLGIRSIAVLPLRDPTGVLGILEAFSTRPFTFGREQLECLQALSEMAELAYGFESHGAAHSPSAATDSAKAETSVALTKRADEIRAYFPESGTKTRIKITRYWPVGVAAVAILLILFVIRLSWRQTGAEIASTESGSRVPAASQSGSAGVPAHDLPLKPDAAVHAQQLQSAKGKAPLKNAAEIQPATDSDASESGPIRVTGRVPSKDDASVDAEPPSVVELAKSSAPQPIVDLPAASQQMPEFGAPVSQGAVAPVLIQRVNPIYPMQARVQGLTGSVVLDATLSTDGSVRKVKVVSGPAVLAAAAVAAVKEWHYTPGMLNGKRVETQQRVTVVFRLP